MRLKQYMRVWTGSNWFRIELWQTSANTAIHLQSSIKGEEFLDQASD
jgi:hypothetical protein